MRATILVTAMLCVAISEGRAQEVEVIPAQLVSVPVAAPSVVFLTRGPLRYSDTAPEGTPIPPPGADWSAGEFYRVSFILSEVYYDLAVERFVFWGPEGGNTKLSWNARVAGSDFAKSTTGRPHLVDLEFVGWTSEDTFVLAEGELQFAVKIQEDGRLIVRPRLSVAGAGIEKE